MAVDKITKERRNIGKNLSPVEAKKRMSGLKWNKDHRGIHYSKQTGVVTAT